MPFVMEYDLAQARPAEYNPRVITPEQFEELCRSVREIGVVKPIIVTTDGLIVAGHQRTKAMRRSGITHCPAHVLEGVTLAEEISFNQLHNASDVNFDTVGMLLQPPKEMAGRWATGWYTLPPETLISAGRPRSIEKVSEIQLLLSKYGPWGNLVVTEDGRVIGGQLYGYAAAQLGLPLHVCVVEDGRAELIAAFLNGEYGKYSYEHLPKTTWAQTLAQKFRLRPGSKPTEDGIARGGRSRTYEDAVIPYLRKGQRILDFGAGQKDYVTRLQREGHNIIGMEFYHRDPESLAFDVPEIQRDVDAVVAQLEEFGLFDVVVCDSVMNSVDSKQAEIDVLTCVHALCKPGGVIAISGRDRDPEERVETALTKSRVDRRVKFFDDDGFTANYLRGVWLYQKFHWRHEVDAIARRYFSEAATITYPAGSWVVRARKAVTLPVEDQVASLRREFDLPYPDGSRVARADQIEAAFRSALARLEMMPA